MQNTQHEMQFIVIFNYFYLFIYLDHIPNMKCTHTSFISREYYFRCVVKLKVHSNIPYFITYLKEITFIKILLQEVF
jgi:hypothetical protein